MCLLLRYRLHYKFTFNHLLSKNLTFLCSGEDTDAASVSRGRWGDTVEERILFSGSGTFHVNSCFRVQLLQHPRLA